MSLRRLFIVSVTAVLLLIIVQRDHASASHHYLRFPWAYGLITHITQGYNSGDTHVGGNYYALDFQIDGGSNTAPVVAAATGVVVHIDPFPTNDCDEGSQSNGKFVDVKSTDHTGTVRYARYAHMSALVPLSMNQTIYQGQQIGLQGNTGDVRPCSTGHHLHFRWAETQSCYSGSTDNCQKEPEPMSGEPNAHGYTSFAQGQLWPSDNKDRPPLIEGMIIKGSGSALYVVDNNAKRLITGPAVYTSCGYKPNTEVKVSDTALNLMSNLPNVNGRPCPYTLMKSSASSPHIYVILHGTKLRIADPNILNACGYNVAHIVIGPVPSGEGTLSSPPCPYVRWPWHSDSVLKGALVKGSAGHTYVVDLAGKHHISSPAVFDDCGYRWNDVATIGDAALGLIPTSGSIVSLPCPYTLIRLSPGSSNWYVFSDGFKQHIADPNVFLGCGYNDDQIVVASAPGTGTLPRPPCPYTRD